MIHHGYKIILIHIPKTGGTSIECLFDCYRKKECIFGWDRRRRLWRQHATCDQYLLYKMIPPEIFKSYFKFAFVRNPWDRVVSEYKWRRISKRYNLSLKEFVQTYDGLKEKRLRNKVGLLTHMIPQYKFIYDDDGNLQVDFVGKFEKLQEDFNRLCDLIEIEKKELPHSQKSKHNHYTEYYDDETIEVVADRYKKDIEYFGYKFGK